MDKRCENCRYGFYDETTGTMECLNAENLTEEEFEKHFVNDKPDCPKWKSSYDPEEEAYIQALMQKGEQP